MIMILLLLLLLLLLLQLLLIIIIRRTYRLVEFPVPVDYSMGIKKNEMIIKYLKFASEIKILWNIGRYQL